MVIMVIIGAISCGFWLGSVNWPAICRRFEKNTAVKQFCHLTSGLKRFKGHCKGVFKTSIPNQMTAHHITAHHAPPHHMLSNHTQASHVRCLFPSKVATAAITGQLQQICWLVSQKVERADGSSVSALSILSAFYLTRCRHKNMCRHKRCVRGKFYHPCSRGAVEGDSRAHRARCGLNPSLMTRKSGAAASERQRPFERHALGVALPRAVRARLGMRIGGHSAIQPEEVPRRSGAGVPH
jgi:hypothetical protein